MNVRERESTIRPLGVEIKQKLEWTGVLDRTETIVCQNELEDTQVSQERKYI